MPRRPVAARGVVAVMPDAPERKPPAPVPGYHLQDPEPRSLRVPRGEVDEEAFDAWLESGHERPALALMKVQRVAWTLALLLFVAWIVVRVRDAWEPYRTPVLVAFFVAVLASAALRIAVRVMDRRAMRKDMELLERMQRDRKP